MMGGHVTQELGMDSLFILDNASGKLVTFPFNIDQELIGGLPIHKIGDVASGFRTLNVTNNFNIHIPQDLLEPGFVKINNVQKQPMPFGGFIQLDWTEPTIFVDNTPITGNMNYNIYVFTSPCLEDVLCDLSYAAPTRIAEASGNSKQVAITTMNYDTVAITSKNDNEYMYAFVKKT